MKPQIIEKNGKPEYAVIPYDEYVRLLELAEDGLDTYVQIDMTDLVPAVVVDRLLAGENPVRVWREHRGFTQQELADLARISKPYLSQIETGEREGSAVLPQLARALNVTVDELVDSRSAEK